MLRKLPKKIVLAKRIQVNQTRPARLAIGESFVVDGKTPGELATERRAAKRWGVKIKTERLPGGTRITRVE